MFKEFIDNVGDTIGTSGYAQDKRLMNRFGGELSRERYNMYKELGGKNLTEKYDKKTIKQYFNHNDDKAKVKETLCRDMNSTINDYIEVMQRNTTKEGKAFKDLKFSF